MCLNLNELSTMNPEAMFAIKDAYIWVDLNESERMKNFEKVKDSVNILFKEVLQMNAHPVYSKTGAEFCQVISTQLNVDLSKMFHKNEKASDSRITKYSLAIWMLLTVREWFKGSVIDLNNHYVKSLASKTK